jgi:membrane-associated phospholipid phosphatase
MKSAYKINLILLILFLLCFTLLLLCGNNRALFININSYTAHSNPFIWANLTFLGDTLPACGIMLLFIRKRPDLVWSGILATLIATVIVNILKLYLNIPRPAAIIDRNLINIIGPALYRHSFPSGHTVTIFTLEAILIFYFRNFYMRLGIVLLALLTGISRIVVGAHWPIDILAGASLGIICGTMGVYIITRFGWNRSKSVQLIIGFILILSNFYLLLFYNCGYEQAIYLQSFMAIAVLVAGIREYYVLLKNE